MAYFALVNCPVACTRMQYFSTSGVVPEMYVAVSSPVVATPITKLESLVMTGKLVEFRVSAGMAELNVFPMKVDVAPPGSTSTNGSMFGIQEKRRPATAVPQTVKVRIRLLQSMEVSLMVAASGPRLFAPSREAK